MEPGKRFRTGPAGQAVKTLFRFPWPLAASLIGTATAMALSHISAMALSHSDSWWASDVVHTRLVKLEMVAFLGIGLCFALALLGER